MRGTGVTAAGLALAMGIAGLGRAGAAEARGPGGEEGPGAVTAFTSLGFARMRGEGCLAYVGQGFVEEAERRGSVLGAPRPGGGRHVAVRTPAAMEERAVRMLGSAPAAADPDSARVVARSSGTDWVVLGDLEISFSREGRRATVGARWEGVDAASGRRVFRFVRRERAAADAPLEALAMACHALGASLAGETLGEAVGERGGGPRAGSGAEAPCSPGLRRHRGGACAEVFIPPCDPRDPCRDGRICQDFSCVDGSRRLGAHLELGEGEAADAVAALRADLRDFAPVLRPTRRSRRPWQGPAMPRSYWTYRIGGGFRLLDGGNLRLTADTVPGEDAEEDEIARAEVAALYTDVSPALRDFGERVPYATITLGSDAHLVHLRLGFELDIHVAVGAKSLTFQGNAGDVAIKAPTLLELNAWAGADLPLGPVVLYGAAQAGYVLPIGSGATQDGEYDLLGSGLLVGPAVGLDVPLGRLYLNTRFYWWLNGTAPGPGWTLSLGGYLSRKGGPVEPETEGDDEGGDE
ncbi:hypothetical protein L6R50_23325 [Myxococcota bacterium]|nr:hypothetical protein [Myxococcota bacterium]